MSDAALALNAIQNSLLERVRETLAAQGCSVEEWRILDCLKDSEALVMSAISTMTSIPPSALTKIVDRMVANNLVYRRMDSADRRKVNLRLTSRGASSYRHLSEAVDRCDLLYDQDRLQKLAALCDTVRDVLRPAPQPGGIPASVDPAGLPGR